MPTGTVRWYDAQRGFGFVRPDDDGEEVMLHYGEILADGCFRAVGEGQRVEYDLFHSPNGPYALRVRRLFDEATGTVATVLCGDAVQVRVVAWGKPNLVKMAARLRAFGEVKETPIVVRLRAPPHELSLFDDGRAIVKGTGEEAVARRLVTEWLGVRLPDPALVE